MYLVNLCPFRVRASRQIFSWLAIPALARLPPGEVMLLGAPWQVRDLAAVRHAPWVEEHFGTMTSDMAAAAMPLEVPSELIGRVGDGFATALDLERAMLADGFQEYREWLFEGLSPLAGQITAIVTTIACRSLLDVARYLGVRVIRIEASAIRKPAYRFDSHVWDLSGEPGFHEAERRFDRWWRAGMCLGKDTSELREELLVSVPHSPGEADRFEVGVALQDDTNMSPDAHGWTAARLLYKALQVFPSELVLLREHPAAHVRLGATQPFGAVDASAHSVDFVARCKRLLTVNSCVAFDALLMDVPAYVVGDGYLRFACLPQFDRRVWEELRPRHRLSASVEFLATNFSVPAPLFLDPDYMRLRLGCEDEALIRDAHLDARRAAVDQKTPCKNQRRSPLSGSTPSPRRYSQ